MRPQISLRFKILLLSSVLATIPPVVIGFRLIDVNVGNLVLLSRELQLAVVDDIARSIDSEFDESQDRLNALGRVLTNDQLSEDQVLLLALSLVEASEVIDHAAVYDARGVLIDVIREEEAPTLDVPERLSDEILREAISAQVATGNVEIHAGWPRVLVVVPFRAGGEITGFAASLLALDTVQRRVEHVALARFHDDRNSVYVVDRKLRVVAHPDRLRAQGLPSAAEEGILNNTEEQLLAGTLVRSGEFASAAGQEMVGSTAALKRRPWAVVAQIPREQAYASVGRMRHMVLETIAVAITMALLLGLLVSRRITAPLRRLTQFASALAERRFNADLNVSTRDELNLLASALSGAARDLAASEKIIQEESAIRTDLGRYLPAELVDQIVRRERDVALGGERRTISVLFADVVAFTPLTEKLPPEEIVSLLNELFTILTGIIFRHGGTVDKFIGDCVMALFGAPTSQDDHAAKAVAAAEDMLRWLETGNARWSEKYDVTLHLAIGVHSGEAVVGNIGSERRMEYTAIGDVVNVAARLESIARPSQILVTDATRDAAGEAFDFLDAGEHKLPGRSETIRLFEVRI